jgi:hypothetical protein
MKTEKNNPQGTNRNTDTNQTKPSVTTGTSHTNEPGKTPQKEEKETWKNPDPTAPEKRQDVYAGKKDVNDNMQDEDNENEGITDEDTDTDTGPQSKMNDKREGNSNNTDRGANFNDEINP